MSQAKATSIYSPMMPVSRTALAGSLLMLEKILLDNQAKVESWLRIQWDYTPPPFYSSVDLRNSGFKLAPVDTNLFSAGFNNLNPNFLPLCVQAIQEAIARVCPSACKVVLIPEDHTRNMFYLENLATLAKMLGTAGLDVKIGSLSATEVYQIDLPSGKVVELHPLILHNGHLMLENFVPCVCLLNNDLSGEVPEILSQATESLFVPPIKLGWSNRLKSDHFEHYQTVASEFARYLDFDPWLIDPLFSSCKVVDFSSADDQNCLQEQVATLLDNIQQKYNAYKINQKPFVIIKSDSGTYGMGIMVAHHPDDVKNLNRKQRNKMASSKGGKRSTRGVILQEGVYTFEVTAENHVCEPVAYMIDKHVVGGFYRVHSGKGANENLNAPGAHFEPLSFAESLTTPNPNSPPDEEPNRLYVYGVVARLAMLAAAREIKEVLR